MRLLRPRRLRRNQCRRHHGHSLHVRADARADDASEALAALRRGQEHDQGLDVAIVPVLHPLLDDALARVVLDRAARERLRAPLVEQGVDRRGADDDLGGGGRP
jgi:hypothetical protein